MGVSFLLYTLLVLLKFLWWAYNFYNKLKRVTSLKEDMVHKPLTTLSRSLEVFLSKNSVYYSAFLSQGVLEMSGAEFV